VSRGPHSFKESEFIRFRRAADKSGHPDAIIEFDVARRCWRMIPRKLGEASTAPEQNEWDRDCGNAEAAQVR
jgi:hypothetical protein